MSASLWKILHSIWNYMWVNKSTILSAAAFILSIVVWIRQGRYEGKLAKIKLEKFNKIEIFPQLIMGEGSERLKITNIGDIDAYNVELEYGNEVPIRAGEYNHIFPIEKFHPNTPVSLLFQLSAASPSYFKIILKWEDAKGKKYREEKTLYTNY